MKINILVLYLGPNGLTGRGGKFDKKKSLKVCFQSGIIMFSYKKMMVAHILQENKLQTSSFMTLFLIIRCIYTAVEKYYHFSEY